MKNFSKQEINGFLIRLVVTFIQGFAAVWVVSGFKLDNTILGGAVAAGLSAVYNAFIKPSVNSSNNITGA